MSRTERRHPSHYLEALVNLQKAELEIYSEADPALMSATLADMFSEAYSDNPSFAAAACRAAEFYFDHFCDSKYGGVFSEVTEEGIVINRWKGTSIKCDHHSLRMCEMIIENELLPVRD